MPLMSEIVGRKGAYFLLNEIYARRDIVNTVEITSLMEEIGISDDLFSELTESGLFIESPDGFYISSLGKKVTLLLKAVNDKEGISEVFQQLTYLYPTLRPYELITENITDYFIDSLYTRPDFIRIYICSPWIRLDENHIEKIKNAIFTASKRYINLQIFIITLPLERYRDRKATETLKALKQVGAEIVINSRLHAKLYISEPGPSGGNHYAIFGSENLTGRRNIELAIKIQNDNEILRKLNLYFYEIWQESQILKEV
jgi:hypothetical protein